VAVEKLESVTLVNTDMNDNTVTATFDDEVLSAQDVIESLNDAGYLVKGHSKLN
jgi:copper chaperone CopZ